MIITQQDGCHKVLGDVTKIETSIDVKNLDFITTLLSSNLYSNPEQSFIREIVSNAWDSHLEAGTTDTPILINYDSENGILTIRDYGTGLDYDKFIELYCSIGNSSKRGSNEYIGGFGIGRYSSLAVSNNVEIISYYNSKKYVYILSKTGNTINTDFIESYDTDEQNGLQISVKINYRQLSSIRDSLKYISFFPNIFVKGLYWEGDTINKDSICHYNTFAVSANSCINQYNCLHVLIGNVLYPLNRDYFDRNVYDHLSDCRGLVPKIEIGRVDVTPNRENIIYTQKTIKIIEDKLNKVLEEIGTVIKENTVLDKENFKEYIDSIKSEQYFNFHTKKLEDTQKYSSINIEKVSFTYKGEDYKKVWGGIHYFKHADLGTKYYNGRFRSKLTYYNNDLVSLKNTSFFYVLKNFTKFTTVHKDYITTQLENKDHDYLFISDTLTFEDFTSAILMSVTEPEKQKRIEFLQLYYDEIIRKAPVIDFNDASFKAFKELRRKEKSSIPKDDSIISLVKLYSGYSYRNEQSLIQWERTFKQTKGCIVLVPYTSRAYYNNIYSVLDRDKYHFYTGSEKTLQKIKALNLKRVIDVSELCSKNRFLKVVKTFQSTYLSGIDWYKYLAPYLQERFNIIEKAKRVESAGFRCDSLKSIEEIPIDDSLKEQIESYNKLIDKCHGYLTNGSLDCELRILLCLKQKLFAPSINVYKNIKNHLIYKVLCQR